MRKERKADSNRIFSGIAVFFIVLTVLAAGSFVLKLALDKPVESVPAMSADLPAVTTAAPVQTSATAETTLPVTSSETEIAVPVFVTPHRTEASKELDKEFDAGNAVLFNAENGEIIAYRGETQRMFPASLTKVMTLIVAVENIPDLDDKVTITDDMVRPMIELDASRAGFEPGETPTLRDVLYGMILSSGADAALAAAEYVAGSEEKFVELMNEKAADMGLECTHFTNVSGLHDTDHYSTASDMGTILSYAYGIDLCREILSAVEYTIPPTEQNPEGLPQTSTLFSRMYGDEMPGVTVLGGKTGYTDEARHCVECFADADGRTLILVIAGSHTKWNAIYDTLSILSVYGVGGEKYQPDDNNKEQKN
ncbi:MAG: D-alanyl-D-alanine carboxypeptidase [Ruminococcus sp.]|nr:D-alanyl-D-alanine carboxypeptidase [Ruminococcus sp.]